MQYSDCPMGPKWLQNYCLKHPKSRCKYQQDKVLGRSTYAPPKHPLPEAAVKVVMPILNRLGNQNFLEGCKNVSNHNTNKSFNKVLWSLCPKEQFNCPKATHFAVSLAVCLFIQFWSWVHTYNLLKSAGLEYDTCLQKQWRSIDKEKIRKGDYAGQERWKAKWKLKKQSEIKKNKTRCLSKIRRYFVPTKRISKNWLFSFLTE